MSKKLTTPAKPTKLLVEKNAKEELVKGRIEEGTLLYVMMQDGEYAYGSDTDRNFSVQVAVTEETAKNWKATFPENGCRTVPTDSFSKTYKTDPPYPEEENQHVLKIKSRATYREDEPDRDIRAGDIVPYDNKHRPKLYEVVDGKPVDVTKNVQPANGSRGVVAFRATNNKFGSFPVLSGVLVTDLLEEEEQANIASDFGISEDTPSTNRLNSESSGTHGSSGDEPGQGEDHQGSEGDEWF